jgi:FkbM family methyltransferase
MQNNLAQGDIFIDIGANVGYYTLLAAQLVGSEGQVLAFEPETENYKALMGNVRRNGFKNITAVNKATGASSGPATLYLNPLNEGGHSLRRFDAYHDNNETWSRERILKQFPKAALEESVMVVSLDSFLEQTDVKKKVPRIVKIDVEGGEFDVLRGMTGLLRKMDAPDIICEVGRNSAEIIEILQSYNYTLSTLNNDGTTVPYRRSAGVKIKGLLAAKRRD